MGGIGVQYSIGGSGKKVLSGSTCSSRLKMYAGALNKALTSGEELASLSLRSRSTASDRPMSIDSGEACQRQIRHRTGYCD
jgi:hypothetical protein